MEIHVPYGTDLKSANQTLLPTELQGSWTKESGRKESQDMYTCIPPSWGGCPKNSPSLVLSGEPS